MTTEVQEHIRELVGEAYIRAIAGDPWTRVNYTDTYLSLITNMIRAEKDPRNIEDLVLLANNRARWGEAMKCMQTEKEWTNAVWICSEIMKDTGHFVNKYGKVPEQKFDLLKTIDYQEGTNYGA